MKYLLPFLPFIFLSCAAPQIGPKPNVTPVVVSNKATRAAIKKTHTAIKEAQLKAAEGDTALEKAHSYLDQLLNAK